MNDIIAYVSIMQSTCTQIQSYFQMNSYPDRFQISTNLTIHHHPTHRTNQSIVLVIVGRNNWNCDASKNISQMDRIHWPFIATKTPNQNSPCPKQSEGDQWPPDNEFICSITCEVVVRARFTSHRLIITRFDACNIRWWTEQGGCPSCVLHLWAEVDFNQISDWNFCLFYVGRFAEKPFKEMNFSVGNVLMVTSTVANLHFSVQVNMSRRIMCYVTGSSIIGLTEHRKPKH